MTAILLMDSFRNRGIFFLVGIRDGCGIILLGTVVHNEDFDILTARKQGFYTFSHVSFRIVAGNCHR